MGSGARGRSCGYAACAHAVDDRDAARHLYDKLVPYDGQLLLWAWSFVPSSAAFTLGLLAETLGEHESALKHYTDAVTFEEEIGAITLATRTREALSRVS